MTDRVEIPPPDPQLIIAQMSQMLGEKDHQIAVLRAALLTSETRDNGEVVEPEPDDPLANVVTFDTPEEVN
jgi:hypothetical protein